VRTHRSWTYFNGAPFGQISESYSLGYVIPQRDYWALVFNAEWVHHPQSFCSQLFRLPRPSCTQKILELSHLLSTPLADVTYTKFISNGLGRHATLLSSCHPTSKGHANKQSLFDDKRYCLVRFPHASPTANRGPRCLYSVWSLCTPRVTVFRKHAVSAYIR
jgi:hypothetical protein